MKIGILTFQHSVNFGAQLQCLALQETLKSLGHEPEVIQLEFPNSNKFYRGIGIRKNGIFLALRLSLIKLLHAKKIQNKFTLFKSKYLNLSEPCRTMNVSEVASNYDAIITGSDQVWGWKYHSNATFFIGWQPEYKGRRISYAPCCAKNRIEDENKDKITELLKSYDSISVRNQETYNFVNNLVGYNPPIVVDPTFLIDFNQFIEPMPPKYSDYIMVYTLGSEIDGGHKEIINKIKQESTKQLEVIAVVLSDEKPMYCPWADTVLYSADPIEWLNLIYNSDFVYTDSFHALVFALKFRKRFIAYYNEPARAARFVDMSNRFGIGQGIITSINDAHRKKSFRFYPNFEKINLMTRNHITFSLEFIKQATA